MPKGGFELLIVKKFIHTISLHCLWPSTHRFRSVIIPRLYQTAKSVHTWLDPSRRSVTYASLYALSLIQYYVTTVKNMKCPILFMIIYSPLVNPEITNIMKFSAF